MNAEGQYLNLMKRIHKDGVWITNKRTGKKAKTVISHNLTYGADDFPLVTTRQSYWKSAIAELIGYLRGYDNAAQFRAIGCNTWNANANDNEAWLKNSNRKGADDMGLVYGAVAKRTPDGTARGTNTILPVIMDILQGIDNRGEIINFWNAGVFDQGCLRPCMYSHQFSVLGDTLHLDSVQRSCDVPLGLNFNMVQCYALLAIMSKLSGLRMGECNHRVVNAHIYDNQYNLTFQQVVRRPKCSGKLIISNELDSYSTLLTHPDPVSLFNVEGYEHHLPIKYPFAV